MPKAPGKKMRGLSLPKKPKKLKMHRPLVPKKYGFPDVGPKGIEPSTTRRYYLSLPDTDGPSHGRNLELAVRVQGGRAAEKALETRKMPPELRKIFLARKRSGAKAAEEMFIENAPLAASIAWGQWQSHKLKYPPKKYPLAIDYNDVVQAVNEELLKRIKEFNPKKGVKFSTYAWKYLAGAATQEIWKGASPVELPTSFKQRHLREAEQFWRRTGTSASKAHKRQLAMQARASARELFFQKIFSQELRREIEKILESPKLEKSVKQAIRTRWLSEEEPLSVHETGKRLGKTRAWIYVLEKKFFQTPWVKKRLEKFWDY